MNWKDRTPLAIQDLIDFNNSRNTHRQNLSTNLGSQGPGMQQSFCYQQTLQQTVFVPCESHFGDFVIRSFHRFNF
jgi:hypothetical protein